MKKGDYLNVGDTVFINNIPFPFKITAVCINTEKNPFEFNKKVAIERIIELQDEWIESNQIVKK